MKNANKERTAKPENVFYKDKDVTVSRFSVRVRQALYALENISDCHVASIAPNRKPAILMIVIGVALAGTAYKGLIPNNLFDSFPPLNDYSDSLSYVKLVEGAGALLTVIGLFVLLTTPTLHTLRIDMGGNVMDAIVTRRRDYVKKIAVAVGIALRNIPAKPINKTETTPLQSPYTYSELS